MAVVLADVVVVVKRCKEERTPCPYISLYTTVPLVFPRCIYIPTHKYLLSVSLPPSHQGQLFIYHTTTIHPPNSIYLQTTNIHSYLGTLNIAPQSMLTFPLNRTLYYLHLKNNTNRPLLPPHFGSLAQIISRKAPNKKKKCRAGGQNLKKPQGYNACLLHAGSPHECNPGCSLLRPWYLAYTCSHARLHAACTLRAQSYTREKKNVMRKDY